MRCVCFLHAYFRLRFYAPSFCWSTVNSTAFSKVTFSRSVWLRRDLQVRMRTALNLIMVQDVYGSLRLFMALYGSLRLCTAHMEFSLHKSVELCSLLYVFRTTRFGRSLQVNSLVTWRVFQCRPCQCGYREHSGPDSGQVTPSFLAPQCLSYMPDIVFFDRVLIF